MGQYTRCCTCVFFENNIFNLSYVALSNPCNPTLVVALSNPCNLTLVEQFSSWDCDPWAVPYIIIFNTTLQPLSHLMQPLQSGSEQPGGGTLSDMLVWSFMKKFCYQFSVQPTPCCTSTTFSFLEKNEFFRFMQLDEDYDKK